MARIVKRGKNSWRIEVELARDKITGKRRRFKKTVTIDINKKIKAGTIPKKVKDLAIQFEAEVKKGTYFKPSDITLAEYLRNWLEKKKSEIKKLTYRDYKMFIEKHFIPFFGESLLLKDLEPYHIDEYKTFKLKNGRSDGKGGLANRTVEYHMRVLSQALSAAVILELIPKNPAENIPAPKVSKRKQRKKICILTPEQMQVFIRKGKNHTDFDCWYFSIFTGVRRGEMLGLRLQDINWEKQFARLEQEILSNPGKGGGVIISDLKTEGSEGVIPLTNGIMEMLKRREQEIEKNKLLLGDSYNNLDLVFCNPDGTPINPKTLYNRFKKFTRSLDLEMRYHDLRHNLASFLLACGHSIKTIQEILRHSTSVITTDTYLHLMPKADNKAVQDVEDKILDLS